MTKIHENTITMVTYENNNTEERLMWYFTKTITIIWKVWKFVVPYKSFAPFCVKSCQLQTNIMIRNQQMLLKLKNIFVYYKDLQEISLLLFSYHISLKMAPLITIIYTKYFLGGKIFGNEVMICLLSIHEMQPGILHNVSSGEFENWLLSICFSQASKITFKTFLIWSPLKEE